MKMRLKGNYKRKNELRSVIMELFKKEGVDHVGFTVIIDNVNRIKRNRSHCKGLAWVNGERKIWIGIPPVFDMLDFKAVFVHELTHVREPTLTHSQMLPLEWLQEIINDNKY